MAEQKPGDRRGDLIQLRPRPTNVEVSRGRTALITGFEGEAHQERPAEGLYVYDTRVLARYNWLMNGQPPALSCASNVEQSSWIGYFTQTPKNCKSTPTGECDPLQETVELRLSRSVGEGMHEDVRLTNHTQVTTRVKLELQFEIAFTSQTEAEQGRKQRGRLELRHERPGKAVWQLAADYRVEHRYSHQGDKGIARMHRGIILRVENAGSRPRIGKHSLSFQVRLKPHQEWHACLSWIAAMEGRGLPLAAQCSRVASSDWDQRRARFFASSSSFSVPHADDLSHLVGRVLERSRSDMESLRLYDLDSPGGIALGAGVPTYMEVFGRDMQAAAWQGSILSTQFLRGALNVFRAMPATSTNDWRDEQPGRIPHELHTDPLSVLNFRPQSLYYGDVTSSYLLPVSVTELWRWTGDLDSIRPYVDAAMGALEWADKYSRDSNGFYRYQTRSEQGVKNQGWKDSNDAIVYEDGSQVRDPLGTCEMQAFVYVAKLHFSEVMWHLGRIDVALRLFREAEELKKRFNEKFWMEKEGFLAMGIDGRGRMIRSIAADAGHCLLAGIVEEKRVKQVAQRMMRDDLFSGWGIRTLSSSHPAYNPFSYHRGSVWPVTNAGFVLAFSRYGLHGEMHRLAKALFETAALFECDRLPEVFGGHTRTADAPFPGLYTRADWPQAWSASAPFAVMQALLGIYPYAPANLLLLDPHLPDWLPNITLQDLRVGKAVVTLRFARNERGETDYEIVRLDGKLHVIRQPSPWSLTTGWAERIRDVIESFVPFRRAS